MNGKKMKVSEYTLKFGSKDRFINVYGLYKYLKNGNNYILYSDSDNISNDSLYYGIVHKNTDKLVVMAAKEQDSEIIKEITYKIIHQESLNDYQPITIGDIMKVELIAFNKLEVKSKVLKDLEELTIPKKIDKSKEEVSGNGISTKTLFMLLIFLIVAVGGMYFYLNQDKFLGSGKNLVCSGTYPHDKLDADIQEKVTIEYDRYNTPERIITNTSYVFRNYKTYSDFRSYGEYFSYMPGSSTEGGYDFDDDNMTYKTIVYDDPNVEYFKPTDYEEAKEYYEELGYTCVEKTREE